MAKRTKTDSKLIAGFSICLTSAAYWIAARWSLDRVPAAINWVSYAADTVFLCLLLTFVVSEARNKRGGDSATGDGGVSQL
jgi:hypothetical protein